MKVKFKTLVDLIQLDSDTEIINIDMHGTSDSRYALITFETTTSAKRILSGQIPCLKHKLPILFSEEATKFVSKKPIETKSKCTPLDETNLPPLTTGATSTHVSKTRDNLIAATRRVRCPVTKLLITKEQYAKNKEEGKYKEVST